MSTKTAVEQDEPEDQLLEEANVEYRRMLEFKMGETRGIERAAAWVMEAAGRAFISLRDEEARALRNLASNISQLAEKNAQESIEFKRKYKL